MLQPSIKCLAIAILFIISSPLHAQLDTLFFDIQFGASVEEVKQKISPHAGSLEVFTVDQPIFPLAKHKETHLIATDFHYKGNTITEIAFTFGDDQLKMVEAQGEINVFTNSLQVTPKSYLDYQVYFKQLIFVHLKEQRVWFLSKEAAHPNLFVWSNPNLPSQKDRAKSENASAKAPDFLEFGASLETLKPVLEANSQFISEMELDGSDPNAQIQIDCFGIPYAGFPRKMEARFGDNQLNMVWILTGKQEEGRIRKGLIDAYGKPLKVSPNWEVFNEWKVILRKDKPEVLLIAPKLVPMVKQWIEANE